MKSLNYAKSIESVDEKVVNVIMHSRKSVLFHRDNVCVKKENPNFDVTMGNYDGAELCKLTGLYIFKVLSSFQKMTGPQAERVKKKICEIFQICGLKVTIETNLQIKDFLEVTSNLKNKKYCPFRKSNNDPLYINALSNHPETSSKKFLISLANVSQKYLVTNMNLRKQKGIITKLQKRVVSVKKLSTLNKILLNVYDQEKLYSLTLHTVAISKQMQEKPLSSIL